MSHQMIRTRVDRGALHVLHRAVFAVGHPGPVELGDETAALLASGERTALSHRSACWIWGLLKEDPGEVEVVAPSESSATGRPGITVHRSRTLRPASITVRQGLPIVRPALALLQLAEHAEDRELELALDEALAVRAVSRTKLRDTLAIHGRGRPGARYLAELVEGGRPSSVTRSDAEERLRAMILSAGLPAPHMQAVLHGFTADFYWPDADYAVEFDGFAFHSGRAARQRDREKDRAFAAGGTWLDRFTWEDITKRELATVARIASCIAERGVMPTSRAGGAVS